MRVPLSMENPECCQPRILRAKSGFSRLPVFLRPLSYALPLTCVADLPKACRSTGR
jgi:hypothetical protein